MDTHDIKDIVIEYIQQMIGIKNIEEIDNNCGTIYITSTSGKVYFMTIQECED